MTGLNRTNSAPRRLSVRLAQDKRDLEAVQRLRWLVFFEEMGASAGTAPSTCLDRDEFDDLCDHLLVIDEDRPADEAVVGTYRLLRESIARKHGGFYSAGEFDLSPLMAPREILGAETLNPGDPGFGEEPRELLELGRSCVLPPYRTSATISMLWRGIFEYVSTRRISVMFGCASFPGSDPDVYAPALSYLYHNHLAPAEARPVVLDGKGVSLNRLPQGGYDLKQALFQLPPLVKGYIRVGAKFGDGAYIDHQFNTVDVCVVMPVELISDRYAARFSVAA